MHRDQFIGVLLIVMSIAIIIVYVWILFFTEWALILLEITAFIVVAGILGIIAWIGYTLATTPSLKPIEEIEKELKRFESKEEEKS